MRQTRTPLLLRAEHQITCLLYTPEKTRQSLLDSSEQGGTGVIQIIWTFQGVCIQNFYLELSLKLAAGYGREWTVAVILNTWNSLGIRWLRQWNGPTGPLSWAITGKHLACIRELIKGMPLNEHPEILMETAVYTGDVETVLAVMNICKGCFGDALVIATGIAKDTDVIYTLITGGCHTQTHLDISLGIAVRDNKTAVSRVLLEAGANPKNISNKQMRITQFISKNSDMIALLAKNGKVLKKKRVRKVKDAVL